MEPNALNIFWGMILILLLGFSAGVIIGYQLTRYWDARRGVSRLHPMTSKDLDGVRQRSDNASPENLGAERVGARIYPRAFVLAQRCMTRDLTAGQAESWVCNCENCQCVRAELSRRGTLDAWIKGARYRVSMGNC